MTNLSFDIVENDTGRVGFSSFDNRLNVTELSFSSWSCGIGSGDRDIFNAEGTTEVRHSLTKDILLGEGNLSVDRRFESDQSDTFLNRREEYDK